MCIYIYTLILSICIVSSPTKPAGRGAFSFTCASCSGIPMDEKQRGLRRHKKWPKRMEVQPTNQRSWWLKMGEAALSPRRVDEVIVNGVSWFP